MCDGDDDGDGGDDDDDGDNEDDATDAEQSGANNKMGIGPVAGARVDKAIISSSGNISACEKKRARRHQI